MFLTYQFSMVGYWPSMAVTGPIESVVESGEGTTSQEGSKRANFAILTQGGSDKKLQKML